MNILLMNDYLECGGAEVQLHTQKKILLDKGHKVSVITFDPNKSPKIDYKSNVYNIPVKNNLFKYFRKLFCDYHLLHRIRKVIESINPDIIIVNSLNLAPITQYKVLEKYKCIQIIHDYSAVCLLGTCIYSSKTVCEGIKYNNCLVQCKDQSNYIKLLIGKIKYKRIYKLKIKNISKFICPSKKLTEYCLKHGYDAVNISNPFQLDNLKIKLKEKYNSKKYVYFGRINEEKGIFQFLDAFNKSELSSRSELYFIGGIDDKVKDKFSGYLNENIKYLGVLEHHQIMKALTEFYCTVVPSLWMENYPTTILESFAAGNLVLGSDRGGIPELLENRGIIFDILDHQSIIDALEKSYTLGFDKYCDLVESSYLYLQINNNEYLFHERLMKEIHSIIGEV